MNNRKLLLLKIDSYLYKTWYMFSELCLAHLSFQRKMKILFSKRDHWVKQIKFGFRFLPHTATFAEINQLPPETIAEYDLIVPLVLEDILYLNKFPDLIKDNLIPIPSSEVVGICDDKYVFAQKMIENNFGDYIPQINGDLPYPFFFKKKIDMAGAHSYFVENHEQELALMQSVNVDEYFRQKFIPGTDDYVVYILFDDHRIVRSITLDYFFEKNCAILGKDEMYGKKVCRICPYLNLFTDILNCIDFKGICSFNYRVIDNHPYIFEINPRFDRYLSPFFFSFMRSLKQK